MTASLVLAMGWTVAKAIRLCHRCDVRNCDLIIYSQAALREIGAWPRRTQRRAIPPLAAPAPDERMEHERDDGYPDHRRRPGHARRIGGVAGRRRLQGAKGCRWDCRTRGGEIRRTRSRGYRHLHARYKRGRRNLRVEARVSRDSGHRDLEPRSEEHTSELQSHSDL